MSAKYIARSTAVAARKLGQEMIIMRAADSTLFSLSELGAIIWLAADGSTPLSDIVQNHICAEFDVEPNVAYDHAVEFVDELARCGVLIVCDEPILAARDAGSASA